MKRGASRFFLLILFATLCAGTAVAQPKRRFSDWMVGVMYQYQMGFAGHHLVGKTDSASAAFYQTFGANLSGKRGSLWGLRMSGSLKNKVTMELGLFFNTAGFQTRWENFPAPDTVGLYPEKTRNVFNFRYFELPIEFGYGFGKSRLRPIISGGFVFAGLVNTDFYTASRFPDGSCTRVTTYFPDPAKLAALRLSIGAGFCYRASDNITIKAEPKFTWTATPAFQSPLKLNIYTLGLDLAIYFRSDN